MDLYRHDWLDAETTSTQPYFLNTLLEAAANAIISSPQAYPGPSQGERIGLALIAVERADSEAANTLYGAFQELRGTMYPQPPVGPGVSIDRP